MIYTDRIHRELEQLECMFHLSHKQVLLIDLKLNLILPVAKQAKTGFFKK